MIIPPVNRFIALLSLPIAALSPALAQAGDRLAATGGVMQLEGSAGGGLTPWALIAGLGTNRQTGASAYCTRVTPQDFVLTSCGAALGIRDRLELSAAHQTFDLGTTVPGASIGLRVLGAKLRLAGDAVFAAYPWMPQLAIGAQWKHNEDYGFVPKLLGARSADGVDIYLAASRVWLAGPLDRSWLASLTLRSTSANQLGLLGFGGDRGGRTVLPEGSLAMFVNDQLLVGAEYRRKPDHLSAFHESGFSDLFIAWIPHKRVSLVVAYANLGNIADKPAQHGSYVSLQASW